MAKRKKSSRSRTVPTAPGSIARSARGTLRSYGLGALPILDHLLKRMKLEEFLRDYLPKERRGTQIAAARGLTVLVKNFLLARELSTTMEFYVHLDADDLGQELRRDFGSTGENRTSKGRSTPKPSPKTAETPDSLSSKESGASSETLIN